MHKVWFIHTMGRYSATTKEKLLLHAATSMNLLDIRLSEKCQSPKKCTT